MESTHYKVLVVDDDAQIAKLIASLLSTRGHICMTARDGLDALNRIKENEFNAVIADIVMPNMDGLALTRELSKHDQRFPVMIMTGNTDEYSVESAIAAGALEFIKKPFFVSEFILRFDKMMRDHKEKETLRALSLMDELTNLYNRRRFLILAEQSLKVAVRAKKRLLLLFIDIDNLKSINDRNGHYEGDRALIDFANILKKTFRESDIIARIGGDEYVVLLEATDESGRILITRLHKNLKDYNDKGSQCFSLSISLGTTQSDPEYPISIDGLLAKADALMYTQKRRR